MALQPPPKLQSSRTASPRLCSLSSAAAAPYQSRKARWEAAVLGSSSSSHGLAAGRRRRTVMPLSGEGYRVR